MGKTHNFHGKMGGAVFFLGLTGGGGGRLKNYYIYIYLFASAPQYNKILSTVPYFSVIYSLEDL